MGVLDGRRAVVTGAGSGLGAAITAALREAGAEVLTMDRPGRSDIEIDVADESSVAAAFEAASRTLGGVDVLVNSAGVLTESPADQMSLAMWDETIAVDLTGVFLCTRAVLPGMRERRWGRVINLASQLGIKGGVGLAHYSAAKAGVIGFTKAVALEVAADNVLVNAIAPGPIDTPMVEPEEMMKIFGKYPAFLHSFSPMPYKPVAHDGKPGLQEFMTPEEVSDVVAWLAGDGSATISGSQIAVDRGTAKY